MLPAGQGSPLIGTPGSVTTPTQDGAATSAQTANTDELRVTSEFAEVVARDTTPELRVTSEYAEVVARDTTVEFRCTDVFLEVVVERDYAGWDTIMIEEQATNPQIDLISL